MVAPTEVSQLTIEYLGNEVVCSTTQINTDSSVYLAGCTVAGRSTGDYTYGEDKTPPAPTYTAYKVGDEVTYNNVDYYVIADSDVNETSVTLLKKTPLTVSEVNTYGGVGTANNHVNMHVTSDTSASYYQTAYNNGYGGMAYYSSATCGNDNPWGDSSGCTTDYAQSEVKYVVDAWKTAQAPAALEARLIQYDELIDNLGYDMATWNVSTWQVNTDYTPSWVYNNNYWYWTMSQYNDSSSDVWRVSDNGVLGSNHVNGSHGVVRPVITISKSNISS